MVVNDYRPISLIGVQYKIISKLSANWISKVINDVVSSEQYAFVHDRQILDGPLMVNELVEWYKKRRKKMMVLKIDFEKAYDSIDWDFLDRMM